MSPDSQQLALLDRPPPRPTGDLWEPSENVPVTVPVPLPVVVVRVEGPFTALDRKLWLVLLKEAFDDLDKPGHIHEIAVDKLVALFRRYSGRRDLGARGTLELSKKLSEETEAATLWQSIRRLTKTTIEWEDNEYVGINNLLGARMDKNARSAGKLYFTFDPLLAQNLLRPRIFARLRVHAIMRLRSKYAVTLYEVLEAYVNRDDRTCTASIEDVRTWLKVPDDSYRDWKDFRRRVVDPSVREINKHADLAGFTVAYQGLKSGKAYDRIRFTVEKTDLRVSRDALAQATAKRGRRFNGAATAEAARSYEPTDDVLAKVRELAPGWDRQALLARYREWIVGKTPAKNPHGAFLAWVKSFTKSRPPS